MASRPNTTRVMPLVK
ncbi:Protein of unknown function [Bacillus cereus]|nr:Protein of unknown function [Bacillus cereus]